MNRLLFRCFLSTSLVACTLGDALHCEASTPPATQNKLPTVELRVGKSVVQAEVANSSTTRQTGLMGRTQLAPNEGMLFIFDQTAQHCMWMLDTLIDLDVAFLDEEGNIINIETMQAGTTKPHCAKKPAKTALEMNKGWFANHKLQKGGFIRIPPL